MPMQKDEGGRVTLVVFKGTWTQLCNMADVGSHRETMNGKNVQAILPRGWRSGPTFWVCATMLLGNADAMMLAAISREEDGFIWFDGLEVI